MTSAAQGRDAARTWAWRRPSPQTAREARAAVQATLTDWGAATMSGDVTVMVSELVTNACVHGAAPVELALRLVSHQDGWALVCEVADAGTGIPALTTAPPDGEHGRGLALVAALADALGVRLLPQGKAVWFRAAVPGRPGTGAAAA